MNFESNRPLALSGQALAAPFSVAHAGRWLLALALLGAVLLWACVSGPFALAPGDVWRVALARMGGGASGLPPAVDTVV